jgi:hypothetical protein
VSDVRFSFHSPHAIAWDVAREAPLLLDALSAQAAGVPSRLAALRDRVPCAGSIVPFEAEADGRTFVRPYRHLRAFYEKCEGGVIAYKGTEPYAADRDAHLRTLAHFRVDYPARGKSLFSAAEHFAIVEQKVALALGLDEALEDARAAAALQSAHLERFGKLARLPTPLMVVSWPQDVATAHLAALRPLISERAQRILDTCMRNGLGAIVYHYPSVPIRVAHLPHELGPASDGPWLQRLARRADPAATVDSWVDLVARMLSLGFLPGRTDHIGIGHCVEMQNAVIDGGFVDVGSVVRMESVRSDGAFQEMLLAAIADLSKTVRHFVLGPVPDAEAEYRNPSLAMLQVVQRVGPALFERVAHHGASDPRLARAIAKEPVFAALARELELLSPELLQRGEHA